MSTSTVVVPSEPGGIVRAFIIGSIIGFVLLFFVSMGMGLIAGAGIGSAIGIGVFAACWGGPGFGGMMGAVLHYTRHEGAYSGSELT